MRLCHPANSGSCVFHQHRVSNRDDARDASADRSSSASRELGCLSIASPRSTRFREQLDVDRRSRSRSNFVANWTVRFEVEKEELQFGDLAGRKKNGERKKGGKKEGKKERKKERSTTMVRRVFLSRGPSLPLFAPLCRARCSLSFFRDDFSF